MMKNVLKEKRETGPGVTGRHGTEGDRSLEMQLEILWRNMIWREFIVKECREDRKRTGILCEILSEQAGRTREELLSQIYRYGSTLREQDLIARQLFLWLLETAERQECTQVAG